MLNEIAQGVLISVIVSKVMTDANAKPGLPGPQGPAGPAGAEGAPGPSSVLDAGSFVVRAPDAFPAAVSGSVLVYAAEHLDTTSYVPIMTSNSAPNGIASASSEYSTGTAAYKAFGGPGWLCESNDPDVWIMYSSETWHRVSRYELAGWNVDTFNARCPRSWTFEGSDDGITWTILDARVDYLDWISGVGSSFNVASPQAFKKHRVRISSNLAGNPYTGLQFMKLFEITERLWQVNGAGERRVIG